MSDEYANNVRYTPELDNNILLAILLVGISFMWSAFSYFCLRYWDIGINMQMTYATNAVMGCVAAALSLLSMRHCESRFSMTMFFLSMMFFITCCTPLVTERPTDEIAICLLPLFFCALSMFRNRDWFMFSALLVFFVAEVFLWTYFGDYVITMVIGYGASGIIFTYYACGLLLYRDVKSDVLHVTSSRKYVSNIAEPSMLFDIINNVIIGVLMFLSGVYLYTEELTFATCVPLIVVSTFVIVVSIFGMERGIISGGLLGLIVGMYFLCKSFSMYTTGAASVEMLAVISIIPLIVLLIIFYREYDLISSLVCVVLIAYFVISGLFGYVGGISVLLTGLAFLFMYCGICGLVKQEFGLELPFYKYT